MTEHPIDSLTRDREALRVSVSRWRVTCFLAVGVATLALAAFLVSVRVGMATLDELAQYRGQCVSPTTAMEILAVTERVSQVNDACLTAHEEHQEILEKELPMLFSPEQRKDPRLHSKRGDYVSYDQNVSKMPAGKGRGGVLPRKKPKRR